MLAVLTVAAAIAGVLLIIAALGGPSPPEQATADAYHGPTSKGSGTSAPVAISAAPAPTSVPPERAATAPSTQPGQRVIPDQISGTVLPESDPVSVSIPRIGVVSPLVHLGLDDRGELEVPQNPSRAGWFTEGAAPGALGPAVIAGHVTWNGAPGVFYRLAGMRPRDQIAVSRRDGRTAVFTVTRVSRFPKSRFPTQAVYGAIDHAGLRLITCGGTYDASRRRYLDNVVVFAILSAVHPSRHR